MPGGLRHPCPVGNDVVDLGWCESMPRSRFLNRVCAPGELELLRAPGGPPFWSIFAAKEAAYKALRKSFPGLPFVPRDFVVGATLTAVEHEAGRLELSVTATDEFVHAVAHGGDAHVASRIARLRAGELEGEGARRLLRELAAEDPACAIRDLRVIRDFDPDAWDGRGVPRAYAGGRPVPVDVSLSHDGRFAACALSVPFTEVRSRAVSS